MNKLLFHWDDNEVLLADAHAQAKLLKQWTHTAKAFGIYDLLIIGNSPVSGDVEITIEKFATYQEARDAYIDSQFVLLTEDGQDISAFAPPDGEVIYALGSNYANPIAHTGDATVGIAAAVPLWDVVAAGIVLHGVS